MALATLCATHPHVLEREQSQNATLFGFIVDHGYRDGSSDEANRVAERLTRLNIEPRVLTLDWSAHGDPKAMPNFERVARQLRYQAIGKACYQNDIRSLLFAHHADDQAETVMMRMSSKFFGQGLIGIKPSAKIPTCEGIYGVDGSGNPYFPLSTTGPSGESTTVGQNPASDQPEARCMAVESGGIRVHRPLLKYTKEQLIAMCLMLRVEWFEDHTNTDVALGNRNAVRHMHKLDALPEALRRERLVEMSLRLSEKKEAGIKRATEIYESIPITLDLSKGKASFSLHKSLAAEIKTEQEKHLVLAHVMRKLLFLVAPRSTRVQLSEMDEAVRLLCPDFAALASHDERQQLHVAEVTFNRRIHRESRSFLYVLERALPKDTPYRSTQLFWPKSKPSTASDQSVNWSQWSLWDNRYWIRAGYRGRKRPDTSARTTVGFFSIRLLQALKLALSPKQFEELDRYFGAVAPHFRTTLPVIMVQTAKYSKTGPSIGQVEVLALPSLRWTNPDYRVSRDELMWAWDIRYREIDFKGPRHTFADNAGIPLSHPNAGRVVQS